MLPFFLLPYCHGAGFPLAREAGELASIPMNQWRDVRICSAGPRIHCADLTNTENSLMQRVDSDARASPAAPLFGTCQTETDSGRIAGTGRRGVTLLPESVDQHPHPQPHPPLLPFPRPPQKNSKRMIKMQEQLLPPPHPPQPSFPPSSPPKPLSFPQQLVRRSRMMIQVQQLLPHPPMPLLPQFVADKSPIWNTSNDLYTAILCGKYGSVTNLVEKQSE